MVHLLAVIEVVFRRGHSAELSHATVEILFSLQVVIKGALSVSVLWDMMSNHRALYGSVGANVRRA